LEGIPNEINEARKAGFARGYVRANSPLIWWAAFSLATLLGFARLSYGLLLPALRGDFQGSYSIFGLIGTANFVGYLLGTLLLPLLLTRIQKRLLLHALSLLAVGITMALAALSFNLWVLSIWRLLAGLFAGFVTILTMDLTLECVRPEERGQASGLIWMGGAVGILLTGLIAPLVTSVGASLGWRLTWTMMGIASGIAAIGFYRIRRNKALPDTKQMQGQLPASTPSPNQYWARLRLVFQARRLLFLALAFCGFGCGYIIYFTFFITLVVQQGVPALDTGFIWAAIGVFGTFSGWLWGRLIDRWPTGFTLALTLALGTCGSLTVLSGSLVLEFVGAALIGLSCLIGPPIIVAALVKRAVPDEQYAVVYSVVLSIFGAGQIVGPVIAGSVIDHVGPVVGVATTAVALGAGALCACGYGVAQRKMLVRRI
jgi:predicted MFS family arabinose efflux permease